MPKHVRMYLKTDLGFVAGARAGRERYEQMVKLSRRAAESPAVRKATRAAGDKATELTKAAGQKAAERMPKITETAKTGATKVRGPYSNVAGGIFSSNGGNMQVTIPYTGGTEFYRLQHVQ